MSDVISQSLGLPSANTGDKPDDVVIEAETIEAEAVSNTEVIPATPDPDATERENDFKFARTNLYNIYCKGEAALEELSTIAQQSQHPRAYEVLSAMIKNLSDVNDRVLGLHKDKIKLKKEIEGENTESPKTVNNIDKAVFVGTTKELLQQMKKK